ncbi:hypothetical protein BKA69DRAFT_1094343 [Paraphysoderma sedebokerense]|nr:hypothetical protein BKA69DRAFT_1094343 [Paraphysoderma sedebokerense]
MFRQLCLSLFYLWICVFFFPMSFTFFHELGHGLHAANNCQASVSISLGTFDICPPSANKWTFCVDASWFYNSFYRRGITTWNAPPNTACSTKLSYASGGIMGISMMYIILFITATLIWRIYLRYPLRQSVAVGATYLFIPFKWLSRLDLSLGAHALLGFGAMVIQLDVINKFFYAFFPSRVVNWWFFENGDGTMLWRLSGFSYETILNVSYAVFAVLVLIYLYTFYSFYQYIKSIRARPKLSESREIV